MQTENCPGEETVWKKRKNTEDKLAIQLIFLCSSGWLVFIQADDMMIMVTVDYLTNVNIKSNIVLYKFFQRYAV